MSIDKFSALLLLHALGDTIGFKNGDWEFNYYDKSTTLDYVNELIYEFISLGGINGIDLQKWKVSDDTFFHISICKSLLHYEKKNGIDKELINHTKKYLSNEADRMASELTGTFVDDTGALISINRYVGITTSNNISNFTNEIDARTQPYDEHAGGNGAAMRTLIIGACFRGNDNRTHLIQYSIISSMLTHNNASGYLAGFNAALFTALAFENIPIAKWPYILLKYLKSDELKSYLTLDNIDKVYDHNMYIRYWQKYVDTKFDKHGKPHDIKTNHNPMHRIRYFHDNFHKDTISKQIGGSGFLCMIMAYDALLNCNGHWEKLVVYAMLHSGDSDTIGSISGGLYGAVYGFGDVPQNMLKYIERKKELETLAEKLHNMYSQ